MHASKALAAWPSGWKRQARTTSWYVHTTHAARCVVWQHCGDMAPGRPQYGQDGPGSYLCTLAPGWHAAHARPARFHTVCGRRCVPATHPGRLAIGSNTHVTIWSKGTHASSQWRAVWSTRAPRPMLRVRWSPDGQYLAAIPLVRAANSRRMIHVCLFGTFH